MEFDMFIDLLNKEQTVKFAHYLLEERDNPFRNSAEQKHYHRDAFIASLSKEQYACYVSYALSRKGVSYLGLLSHD